jgi:hypothetical protein
MTNKNSDTFLQEEITTEEAFDAALSELIVAALRNGLNPKGGWVCRNGEAVPDTEVMIYELGGEDE